MQPTQPAGPAQAKHNFTYVICNRGQVVTFLWRSNGEPAANQTLLSGRYSGQYYTNALAWSDFGGLLKGTSTAFAPNNKSPRADIVTYLYRNAGSPSVS